MKKILILVFCFLFTFNSLADEMIIGVGPEGQTSPIITVESETDPIIEETTEAEDDFIFYPCIPLPEDLQKYIWNSCKTIGLDYCFALAIMQRESDFRQYVKHYNSNGTIDRGIWQINSCNTKELIRDGVISSSEELFDVCKCTDAAMWELGPIIAKYGNTEKSYAVYNTGNSKINSNKNSRVVCQYWAEWEYKLYGD